jgi:single-stranded DNA-binding protein
MSEIYLQGRTVDKFSLSQTAKGTAVARGLLEVETIRKVGRDQWRAEIHVLPIIAYGWLAEGLAELPPGTSITLGCRLNGTKYEPPGGGEAKHGIQLIADAVSFPPPYRPPSPAISLRLTRQSDD